MSGNKNPYFLPLGLVLMSSCIPYLRCQVVFPIYDVKLYSLPLVPAVGVSVNSCLPRHLIITTKMK